MTTFEQKINEFIQFLKSNSTEFGIPQEHIKAGAIGKVTEVPFLLIYAFPDFGSEYENSTGEDKINIEVHIAGKPDPNAIQIKSTFSTLEIVEKVREKVQSKYQGLTPVLVPGGLQASAVVMILEYNGVS